MPSCHLDPSGIKHAKEKRSQPYSWEQRKLEDIIRRYDNLRVPVTASKRKHGDIPYYGANGIQDFVSGYTHDGEFILVAEDGARDPKNYPVNYVNGKIWVNNHAHVLQGIQGLANNLFLLNGIKKINIAAYLVGGSRAKLNAETLMQLSIKLPSIHEQEKLGQLFQSLDKTITLHEEQHRQLEQLKKALLQKMFADETEYPVLRFKGFTEKWEQRKLGEIADVYDGVHQTPDYQDSGVMFLSVENIKTLKSNKYISEKTFEKNFKIFPEQGDILMTRIGDIGTTNIVQTSKRLGYYVSLALLKPKNIASHFLNSVIATPSFQISLKRRSLLTATPQKINKDEIGKVYFFISQNLQEQEKIGQLFQSLDKTITLHDKKIQYLKQLKRGLLQKMFV